MILSLCLLLFSNPQVAVIALVASLFVNEQIVIFSFSVPFSLAVVVAVSFKRSQILWDEFYSPMTFPFIVLLLCILPSLLNASRPMFSILKMSNIIAGLLAFAVIILSAKSILVLRRIMAVFLGMALFNSFDVFRMAASGVRRPFGFAGIMFVDYAALSVCVAVALAITTNGLRRTTYLTIALTIGIALIFTQTRNTWISALLTICILIVYVWIRPETVKLSRNQIAAIAIGGMVVLVAMMIFTAAISPRAALRTAELTTSGRFEISESGRVSNSLVSRLLIWDTAWRAFLDHPLIGIGLYAFPYSSERYSRMPKYLYRTFVRRLTAHQTHLSMLAETGIIGTAGFIFFLVSVIRNSFSRLKVGSELGKRAAFVIATGIVYSLVSMFFTDAWLWGQGIVLFGILVGSVVAIGRIQEFEEQEQVA